MFLLPGGLRGVKGHLRVLFFLWSWFCFIHFKRDVSRTHVDADGDEMLSEKDLWYMRQNPQAEKWCFKILQNWSDLALQAHKWRTVLIVLISKELGQQRKIKLGITPIPMLTMNLNLLSFPSSTNLFYIHCC